MSFWIDSVIVLLVLTNLALLGTSRLRACVRVVAGQGVAVGLLPLLVHGGASTLSAWFLAVCAVTLKGVVFPRLLLRSLRDADARHEVQPFIGFTASLLLGFVLLAAAVWFGARLHVPGPEWSPRVVPVALFMILAGLFVIVSRRNALNQILGYLVIENGAYAFGVMLLADMPLLVDLGILLDAFVAVFVMGVAIYHINREFDHIEVDQLDTLKG